jgi:hypothetical protein
MVGVTPMLHNKMIMPPFKTKLGSEDYDEHEERVWPLRVNMAPDKENLKIQRPIIPSIWLMQSLLYSQRLTAYPIAFNKAKSMKAYFTGGVLFEDAEILVHGERVDCTLHYSDLDKNGLPAEKSVVTMPNDGAISPLPMKCNPSGRGRVTFIRPAFQGWTADVHGIIINPAVKADQVIDCFDKYLGQYNGIGDYRVQNTGTFGIYKVER